MTDKVFPPSTDEAYFMLQGIGTFNCGTARDIKLREIREGSNITLATPCPEVSDAKWRAMLQEKAGQTGKEDE
jgi:hypothetical protein